MTARVAAAGVRGRAARIAAWALLAVDGAVYAAIYVAPHPGGWPGAEWTGQLAYLLPHATTVVLCGILVARERPGFRRRFWAYLAVSSLLLLTYESVFSYRLLAGLLQDWPVVALAMPLPLCAAALFITALVLLSRLGRSSLTERTRVMLDTVLQFALAVLAVLALVIEPMLGGLGATGDVLVMGAVASTAGFFIVGWVIVNAGGYKTTRWRPWEVVVRVRRPG